MNKIAVYGSLRKGFGNHSYYLEGNSNYLGTDVLEGWVMYNLGAFPAIAEDKSGENKTIVVEVYEVSDQVLKALDGLEGYPHFYNRKEVGSHFGDAWIYFFNFPRENAVVVECGDWKEYKSGSFK